MTRKIARARLRARREVRRRPLLRPVGQARAHRARGRGHARLRARRGCGSGCSTSPTSTPRASRSPARTRHARSKGSTRRAPGRDLLPYLPETGEVVNRMTTSWNIVPAPTPLVGRARLPGARPRGRVREALGGRRAHLPARRRTIRPQAWIERSNELKANAQRLTERRFDALRLHGPGTDLTIGLFPSAHWAAGDLETVDGRRHSPNLPTEEVFATPDPERVDGHVVGDDAARALGLDHPRDPRRVRGRPRGQDRRGRRTRKRSARSPPATTAPHGSARSRSSTAKAASARSSASSTTR